MVWKINFDKANTNGNQTLEPDEFKVALEELASHFDQGKKDGYITKSKDGTNEFTNDFFYAVPFNPAKISNDTILPGNGEYSFWYKDNKKNKVLNFQESDFMIHAWTQAGGTFKEWEDCDENGSCATYSDLTGALTKDDIRKNGITWIEV